MKKTFLVIISTFVLVCSLVQNAHALTISPARYEVVAASGAVVNGTIIIINDQQESKTFYSSFENFEAQGDSGTPKFIGNKDGIATWMNTQQILTLKPGETQKVPFSITIPEGTEPGGYFGTVFWSTTPPNDSTTGQVTIGAKIGMLVFLSVAGEVKEEAGLNAFKVINGQWFKRSLPVEFEYRFSNDGGDRVKPMGSVIIYSLLGWKVAAIDANPTQGSVLPRTTRKFTTQWSKQSLGNTEEKIRETNSEYSFFESVNEQRRNFALGIFRAKLDAVFGNDAQELQSKSIYFVVLPLELLFILFVIGIAGYFGLRTLLQKYNKAIIKRAQQSTY